MTHEELLDYNWDDGIDPVWPVVDSPATEYATALLIYWRLEGPCLESSAASNEEAVKMNSIVRRRLLDGFYPKGNRKYDPLVDNRLSKVQAHKLRMGGCPVELISPEWD